LLHLEGGLAFFLLDALLPCNVPAVERETEGDRESKKGKRSPYSINECRVPDLIPVTGSQPASDASHKPSGRLPLLSARPAVTLATLKRAATISLLGKQRHDGCEQFA